MFEKILIFTQFNVEDGFILFPEIIRFWSYSLVAIDGKNVLQLLPPGEISLFETTLPLDAPLLMPYGLTVRVNYLLLLTTVR